MKKIFFYFVIISCLIAIFCSLFCLPPKVESILIHDAERYLEFNKYVEEAIKVNFVGVFPTKDGINDKSTYRYSYNCSLFGEPNFFVYLKMPHEESEEFLLEKKRIEQFRFLNCYEYEENLIYIFKFPNESLDEFLDDRVVDGMSFHFEIVLINEKTKTIEYLIALQRDNNSKNMLIIDVLKRAGKYKTQTQGDGSSVLD